MLSSFAINSLIWRKEVYSFEMRSAAVVVFAVTLACAVVSIAEEMPHITGRTLTNKQIDFPSACSGSPCIIVIGFSHRSQSQVKSWTAHANIEFRNDPKVATYSVAVLQDAPRLVRGLAVRGIKNSIPEEQHVQFVIIYQGEGELKRIVGFQKADNAYVLLLDRKGGITWTASNPVTDTLVADLKRHVLLAEHK